MSNFQTSHRQTANPALIPRFILAALVSSVSLWGMWNAGRAGASRLLSDYGRVYGILPAADEAGRLCPSDPEAHYARAVVLSEMGRLAEAVHELELAVALRPDDHYLWLKLGRARDQTGDEGGALMAFKEAVRLAPYYALPRWQLGNLLLRMGRLDEAIADLRGAAVSDPSRLPAVIDLAWGAYGGNGRAVEQAVQAQTPAARVALARFFVKHGEMEEAMELFRTAGPASDGDRLSLLNELLMAKRYPEAYDVWAQGRDARDDNSHERGIAALTDGSFEGEIRLNEPGFGWQMAPNSQGVRVSLDTGESHTGKQSLLMDFSGDSNPASPIISQLVLVEPNARYRLTFAARTENLITVGSPLVAVTDPGTKDGHILNRSQPLPRGTSGWQSYTVEFMTSGATSAVMINTQRQSCSSAPCPIFGRVWFDDFSLQRF